MTSPSSHLRFLFLGALVVLLCGLATLQYRWAGQVSEGERDRMRSSLRARATQFAQEFDRELTRAMLLFQSGPEAIIANPGAALAERYAQWAASAPYPPLVGDLYFFEQAPGGAPALARLDRDSATMRPVEWPASLEPLRDHFRKIDNTSPPASIWPDPIDDRVPALFVPIFDVKVTRDDRGELRRVQALDAHMTRRLVIVMLDREAIRSTILPALALRHFGGDAGFDYHVAVVDRAATPAVIYESGGWNANHAANADQVTGLMDVRMDELPALAALTLPLTPGGHTASARVDRFALTIVRRPRAGEGNTILKRTEGPFTPTGDTSRWQLVLRHRAGSLEKAVQKSRTRNLLLGFGVLVLLALASTMVLISTERARRLAAQQVEFVAGVSHELRTPVAVICSAAENLADGVIADNEQVRRYGNLIRGEGRRLADMLERVLELAGAMAGRSAARLAPTDPALVIEEAIEASSAELEQSGVQIERSIATDLPPVLGDFAALRSAVRNLIANAVKYRGTGRSIRISVGVTGGSSRPMVEIAVADSGVGIDAGDLPHIFDPFFRGRAAAAGQIRGTGVGLTVVKRIVDAHGGTVSAASEPGHGSTLTIRIPAHRPSAEQPLNTHVGTRLHAGPRGQERG